MTPTVDGSDFVDRESWDIVAGATWTFFEWGKTRYATNQQRARLRQSKESLEQIKDGILLEVKTAYLVGASRRTRYPSGREKC